MPSPFLKFEKPCPRKLVVDLHSFCNARCTMCPYPRFSRTQTNGHMDRSLYRDIIAQFAQLARQYQFQPQITYCYMGEPFLAPDLADCVRLAVDNGIHVYLNTNGAEMTPANLDPLLDAGFSGLINIGVHAHDPDLYHRITGLDHPRLLQNIEYLLKHYPPDKICIRGVDDNWPPGEKQRWLDHWRPRGVKLEYLPAISRCGAKRRLLPKRLRDPAAIRLFGCSGHHPLHEMVILFDGRAVMCCQDMAREIVWGNVATDGLLNVWNSPTRRQTVDRLYSGKPQPQEFLCARCEQALTTSHTIRHLLRRATRKPALAPT